MATAVLADGIGAARHQAGPYTAGSLTRACTGPPTNRRRVMPRSLGVGEVGVLGVSANQKGDLYGIRVSDPEHFTAQGEYCWNCGFPAKHRNCSGNGCQSWTVRDSAACRSLAVRSGGFSFHMVSHANTSNRVGIRGVVWRRVPRRRSWRPSPHRSEIGKQCGPLP